MRKLHIISIQKKYLDIVTRQLFDIWGDQVQILPITLQQLTMETVSDNELVLLSKEVLRGITAPFIPDSCCIIIANREVNIAATEKISSLSTGQRILIINDTVEHAHETAESLKNIYYEHDYITFDPNRSIPNDIDWIVTPGELELVPGAFDKVINIGSRMLDFRTIESVEKELETNLSASMLRGRYFKSQVTAFQKLKFSLMKEDINQSQAVEQHKEPVVQLNLHEINTIKEHIEKRAFLDESLIILSIYKEGKDSYELLGRTKVKERLKERRIVLSDQQLRLRLEVMQDEKLIHARIGRAGTKISEKGEAFLEYFSMLKK